MFMRIILVAAACALLMSTTSEAQRRSVDRFVTYTPVDSAALVDGVEYRDDNVKAGRIYVSSELLAGLPFAFQMQEQRGGMTRTVPAIRAEVAFQGQSHQLNAYYHGGELSFQSAIQNYRDRQSVMDAVDAAITGGESVRITVFDLQSEQKVLIHDGVFAAR